MQCEKFTWGRGDWVLDHSLPCEQFCDFVQDSLPLDISLFRNSNIKVDLASEFKSGQEYLAFTHSVPNSGSLSFSLCVYAC